MNFGKQELNRIVANYRAIDGIFIANMNTRNSLITIVGAIVTFCIQLFNIYRVLVLSPSGLTSYNNRIYFYFYIVMLIVAATTMFLHFFWKSSINTRYYCHVLCAIFYIYWNLFLNSYSTSRDVDGSNIVFITALIFTSILFRFKLWHSIFIQLISYCSFLAINYHFLQIGDIINISITTLVTVLCCTLLFVQEVKLLCNQQELLRMNKSLKKEEDNLRIELEKHQLIMQETSLFSFDWNLLNDTLIPSRNCSETLGWPASIIHPYQWIQEHEGIYESDRKSCFHFIDSCIKNKKSGTVDIRIKDYTGTYTWYRLQLFIQSNQDNIANTALGILLNIDGTTKLINNLSKQLQDQLDGSKQYIEHLKNTHEQTAIYRHDMRHSLKLMELLAHQGNMDKLCEYLAETHNKLDSITPNYYCENETVNLILGSFALHAKKQHIVFTTDVALPESLSIVDTDLCSLLFNLLENAITAASSVEDSASRIVHIQSIYKNNKLLIFVQNGFVGEIIMKNDVPVSPLAQEGHGFGIKSIMTIVDKYEGLYTFEIKEHQFYAKVMLEI
ncbi:MAG: GHKL domain-containing protein [Eubacteriales bacterium]